MIETTLEPKRPHYVMLMSKSGDNFTCLRLTGKKTYFRDAGDWDVDSRFDEETQTFRSVYPTYENLDGLELRPCAREEWAKDNEGYIDDVDSEDESDDELPDELPF